MTYIAQFTGGPLDGVKFETPIPFDEIRLTRAMPDGSGPTVLYECDWEQPGVHVRVRDGLENDAVLLNFVVGDDDEAYEPPVRPK